MSVHASDRPALLVESRAMVMIGVMAATTMQVLDSTIANVALPHMQGTLSASQDQIVWVLTSYIVAAAIMTPATGWLAERFGRKRLFLFAVTGFTAASALCGQAHNLIEMVIWRFVQGLLGAPLIPLSQAVLLDIHPQSRHGQAMAIWGAGVVMAPIFGPIIGGWLTDNWNWRWVFYINVPVGMVTLLVLAVFLVESPRRDRPFDRTGFLLLALALAALQLMLDRGERADWFASPEIWTYLLLALSGAWLFAWHIPAARHPFITPLLFRDRIFVSSLAISFALGLQLFSTVALLPPMLQHLMGYPVVTTGLVLAPRGFGMMVGMMLAGRLMRRIPPYLLIGTGMLLSLVAMHWMAGFSLQMDWRPIAWSGLLQGFGLGLAFSPLSATAFRTLPTAARTEAAGLYTLARNIGAAIGISVLTALLTRKTQEIHALLGRHITPFAPTFNGLAVTPYLTFPGNPVLALLNGEVTRQAAMIAYVDIFAMVGWLGLAGLPLVLLLRHRNAAPSIAPESEPVL